jgi:hypothetical protein
MMSFFQAHPKAKPWRTKSFPLYDDIAPLVEGRVATGEGVFHAGNNSLAGQNSASANESEPGDKASVTNGDDDDEKREESDDVGVFYCVSSLH